MYRALFILPIFLCSLAKGQMVERAGYGGIMYKSYGLGIAYQKKFESFKPFGKQLDAEMAMFHHPQETKSFNTDLNNPSPFVFGKLNKVAILKVQYAITKKISQFSESQRVGIDMILGGGMIIGFLKPVYINLIYPSPNGYETVVAEKYNPGKHTDITKIAGYADSRVGWNEVTSKVGLSVSGGAGFTWGYFSNFPKRLESGFYLEYFDNGLPVMAFVKNKNLIQGVYVKLLFGKRVSKN